MKARFQKMGGKYNQWYTSKVTDSDALRWTVAKTTSLNYLHCHLLNEVFCCFLCLFGLEMKILNCGITGGQRDVMLKFLSRMVQVLQDPALAIRQKNEDINLNLGLKILGENQGCCAPHILIKWLTKKGINSGYPITSSAASRYAFEPFIPARRAVSNGTARPGSIKTRFFSIHTFWDCKA